MISTKLKKTIAVLGLAVPLTCFAAGEIDNETLSVTATLPSVITLTFVNGTTIALGNLTATSPPVSAPVLEPFCVGYNGGTTYSVEAHSLLNAGGAFALTRNGDGTTDPIAMSLTWLDALSGWSALIPTMTITGISTDDGTTSNTLDTTECGVPSTTNGDLQIDIAGSEITGKVSGYFSDSILITVTGE